MVGAMKAIDQSGVAPGPVGQVSVAQAAVAFPILFVLLS
jgi:hypothetical protein